MDSLNNSAAQYLGTPEAYAAKMRRVYPRLFAPPGVCLAAAVGFSVVHFWLFSAVFLASALMYFPASLSQYRSNRRIIEKAIMSYQQWYQSHAPDAEADTEAV